MQRPANKICVRCGLKSASHSRCDGNAALKKACSQCSRLNLACFFLPDDRAEKKRKGKQTNSIGNAFKANFIRDIARGAGNSASDTKGCFSNPSVSFSLTGQLNSTLAAQVVSWNNRHHGHRLAQFEKVNRLLEPRFNVSTFLPSTTGFANAIKIPSHDIAEKDKGKKIEKREIDNQTFAPDRFELPSNQMLDAIHHAAQKNLMRNPKTFGSYQPDVLIALGILLQEVAFASKETNETVPIIPNHILEERAPNLFDVLGPQVVDLEYRNGLVETLKNRKKRVRLERLFHGGGPM